MSQTGYTPIQLYRTSTASAVPTAGNLAAGELAINLTDEKLYFKNASGTVTLLASSASASNVGTVTSVAISTGTTGLTVSGSPITSSGTITIGGTLAVANGGTGTSTAFTTGSIVFAGASGVYTQDNANLFWDDTNNLLGVGTSSPAAKVNIVDNSVNDALRITQTGTGNALVVEDSANPDSTPFVIFADGRSAQGHTSSLNFSGASYLSEALGYGSVYPFAGGYTGASATGPRIGLIKNRSADWSTNTIVQSGDTLGDIAFTGADGSDYVIGARIIGVVDGTPGVGDMPGRLVFQTTADGASTATERMRIDSSGNVGIATSSPTYRLQVETNTDGNAGAFIRNSNTGTSASGTAIVASGVGNLTIRAHSAAHTAWPNATLIQSDSSFTGGLNIFQFGANPIVLWTNNTERARITPVGYLEATYSDKVVALGNTGTAKTIDLTQGNVFTATLTGNCTFTLSGSNANASRGSSFTLILTNDATAGRTVAWAGGNFRFPGGAASLSRTTTANAVDIWVFFTPDQGTTWYGNISMKNMTA